MPCIDGVWCVSTPMLDTPSDFSRAISCCSQATAKECQSDVPPPLTPFTPHRMKTACSVLSVPAFQVTLSTWPVQRSPKRRARGAKAAISILSLATVIFDEGKASY